MAGWAAFLWRKGLCPLGLVDPRTRGASRYGVTKRLVASC